MKKITFLSTTLFFLLSFFFSTNLHAQKSLSQQQLVVSRNQTNGIDEQTLRQRMKADGVSDAVIDKLLAQRKLWMEKGKNVMWTNLERADQTPIANAACGDMGAENGWGSWSGKQGDNSAAGNAAIISWQTPSNPPPAGTLFNITSGTGIDPNTPSAGNPSIPVVCPNFGNHSIVLNQSCTTGFTCEQLTYPLTVTPADTNFVYAYAIVIENAGHIAQDMPFVEFGIYDINGNVIPCSFQHYTGGTIPGFYYVNGSGCGLAGTDQYKPWTYVGVNLSPYIGQTVNIVITNADCDQGGHFAYSYWDFACGSIPISSCTGNQSSICGPTDPQIAYTYQWYKNGTAMAAPAGTQQCISIIPNSGDTYFVNVNQPSGCNFSMNYVASGAPLQSLFTYALNTNTITCTNLSVSASNYAWNFGDGSTSTLTNPVHTYSATGTYSVCLIASSSGCADTVCKIINIAATAIQEQEMSSRISVYPNPAKENMFVDFGNNNFGKAKLTFRDLIGRIIYETRIPATGKQVIDVSGYSKGIYFIQLKTDYGIETKKIVIAE